MVLVKLRIYRFDPSTDEDERFDEYLLEAAPKDSLLNLLLKVKEEHDPTLAVSYSCRKGVCGSCTVLVNGIPMQACQTTIEFLVNTFGSTLVVEPLKSFRVLKDLVVDRRSAWNEILRTRGWLHRLQPYFAPEFMSQDIAKILQSYRDCVFCMACSEICPVKKVGSQVFSGPHILRLIHSFSRDPRDGLDRSSVAVAEGLYKCLVCDACSEVCPRGINIGSAVLALRAEAYEKGLAPEKIKAVTEAILDETVGNPLWLSREERGKWTTNLEVTSKAGILVYAGCMASYADNDSVIALARLLEEAGLKYIVLGEKEHCCGMPLLLAGDLKGAKKLAEENARILAETGAKMLVTPCPSCYRMFKHLYPEYLDVNLEDKGIRIMHAVHLVYSLLREGRLKVEPIETIATYHDPCDLGRHEGVYEEPRIILRSAVAGFVEMKTNKQYAQCCGAGGNLRIIDPELSLEIGVTRIKQAPKAAEIMAHACPTCKVQLKEASERAGANIEHLSIQEIVVKALQK